MTERVAKYQRFFAELRRRHVYRVIAVYGVVGFVLLQVMELAVPALLLPSWTYRLVALLILVGFPMAVVITWAFEITPDGIRKTRVASAGEIEAIVAEPAARRWSSGVLALVGLAMLGGGWWAGRQTAAGVTEGVTDAASHTEEPSGPIRSIAVLPFANLSTDAENEVFSDGLTEELLNVLAQLQGLSVPARTSSFAFKGQNTDIREIGRQLGVEMVVEGSVRKAGDLLRITAQLIDTSTGAHVWSETYDRRMADVFAIQEEIAQAIAGQLLPRFAARGGGTQLVHTATLNVDAYQYYLEGRHQFWQQSGEEGLRRAATFFELAIENDPDYAIAHAGLADAYMLLGGSGFARPSDIFPLSKAAAERALELDERLAEGYVALASVNWQYDWDWAAAAQNYRRSFSVNPLLHTRCICYAWYLAVTGDTSAAVLEAERARAMDPLARLPRIISAWMYYLAGRPQQAREQVESLFEMNPSDGSARRIAAWLAWDAGDRQRAISILEQMAGSPDQLATFADRGSPMVVAELGTMYGQTGRAAEARTFAAGLEARAGRTYIPPEYIAAIHGALGEYDRAFEWLERAFVNRSNLPAFHALPFSRPLRDQPRYRALIDRVGLPARR